MRAIKLILMTTTTTMLFAGQNVSLVKSPVAAKDTPAGFYVGVGGVWAPNSIKCPCKKGTRKNDNPLGGMLRVGYDFNRYFGVEGRYLKAKFGKNFATVTHYGLYLKLQYRITYAMTVYGLIGYGKTTIDYISKSKYNSNSVSFGMGIEYDLSQNIPLFTSSSVTNRRNISLWIDYQNLLYDQGPSAIRANAVSVGFTYHF